MFSLSFDVTVWALNVTRLSTPYGVPSFCINWTISVWLPGDMSFSVFYALVKLSSPTSKVIRGGEQMVVTSSDLVPAI